VNANKMDQYKQQATIFKALMHPARLAILDILRVDEACVCHMEALLGYRQAYISQHLAVLREAGLVQDRRDGWNVYYQVTGPDIFALLDISASLAGIPISRPRVAPPAQNCPCPKCNCES
jgi:DNA-binding transcriptional ArsR family regulator